MSYFLGIDVSTTASKVLAIDEKGIAKSCKSYLHTLQTPKPLWSEQHPHEWWQATLNAIKDVLKEIPANKIASIGLTGQMHGLVILDKHGKVLRPAILWNDGRSSLECESITKTFGAQFILEHIGSNLFPCFLITKLLWLKKHEPDCYNQIAHILLPKDYIRFCLSGKYITDVSDGSGIGLMDIAKRTWSDVLLQEFDLTYNILPKLCESPEVSATVSVDASIETGLIAGTLIVGGAGDQPAQSVGSGVIKKDMLSLTIGTSGVILSATDSYNPDPKGRVNTFCYAIPGYWFNMGVTMSAAGSLRWFRDNITPGVDYPDLDLLASNISRGSNGLLFTPYLSGERHPYSDPFARGNFVGLTLRHNLSHMVRAVLEGVAFSLRDVLDLIKSLGIDPISIMISGGAANSLLWKNIIAEIMGATLYTINSNEGAAFGAAILGAVGAEAWSNVPEACNALVKKNETIIPDKVGIATYKRLYPVYRDIYPQLQTIFDKLSKFEEWL
ncbi:MAG: xylB [Burkholderiales bacterium]|jgi:xylulokinase|nr:xylB [Burkholderiales bacterium]